MIRSPFIVGLGAVAAIATGYSTQSSYQPVATIEQIMEASVEPTSNAVFDAAAG